MTIEFVQPDLFAGGSYTRSLTPGRTYAYFVEPDDSASQQQLADVLGLTAGQPSPYNVPPDKQYLRYVYTAPG